MKSRTIAGRALLALCIGGYAYPQGLITTVAGTDRVLPPVAVPVRSAALGEVWGAVADDSGSVFVASLQFSQVVRISPAGVLTVVAGNGRAGFSGDGGPAVRASVRVVQNIALDREGRLIILDTQNHRIRRVNSDGTIVTIAGNGQAGFSGDGGPATDASLIFPIGAAEDLAGNLYIADQGNHRIRRVAPNGVITTVAGDGRAGYNGDGIPAVTASLNSCFDVAVDLTGNVFIADLGNLRVRRVGTNGIITTVAGNGQSGPALEGVPAVSTPLASPLGVAVDRNGNLFIADANAGVVRRVTPDGIIRRFAGGGDRRFLETPGPATQALFKRPTRVTTDTAGNLYVSDTDQFVVFRVSPDGTMAAVAGHAPDFNPGDGDPAASARLSRPNAVAVDADGNLYIADQGNHRIRRVTLNGIISTIAGNGLPGFSADGGAATNASIDSPSYVAVDRAGNLLVADTASHRIRRVAPGGTITTVAGSGRQGFSGDLGQATAAQLASPAGIAIDSDGTLFIADQFNHRIRRVSPSGIIDTVAGNGQAGYAGDNVQATSTSLNLPQDVAVDAAGNLYIADTFNRRVRRVTRNGVITTVAGNGADSGPFEDGIPAVQASLAFPTGVAVDTSGNVLITDRFTSRVRMVRSGIITTVAGSRQNGFTGDGGPATQATLLGPVKAASDTRGNIYIADTFNNRIRGVLIAPASFRLSTESLTFTAKAGGAPAPGQSLQLSPSVAGLSFTIQTDSGGGNWLRTTPSGGSMPVTVEIMADPAGLRPGVFRGNVTVTAPNASPSVRNVAVTFNVEREDPPQLKAEPAGLAFSFTGRVGDPASQLTISNPGGGSLAFTALAATDSGGRWLAVSPPDGSVSATSSAVLTVTANPAGLDPGTYRGRVSTASSTTGERIETPVTMTISAVPQTILLSQSGLSFTAVAGGGAVPPQTFGVLNVGQGVMNWSVTASTLSGGTGWLSAAPNSGSTDAASLSVPLVEVGINASQLVAGTYYGQVQITAPAADNSPQLVSVVLNVLPAGSDPGPLVRPTGLIFAGVAGGTSPGSQSVVVSNISANPASYASNRLTFDGTNWFVHLPTNATVTPTQPSFVVVQPDLTGLTAGVRRGVVTLLFQDGNVRHVNLLFVLASRGGLGPRANRVEQASCTPSRLLPLFTSLGTDFNLPAAWPIPVEVRVVDDCGNPMITGSVVASFSNGDPPLPLTSLRDARWSGTWQARNTQTSQVTTTVLAEVPELRIRGTAQVTGSLRANQVPPVIGPGAVVDAASFSPQAPLAPGSLVSIFGTRLAERQSIAERLPLATELAGTRAAIGGRPLPLLFASEGQINAMIPYDTPVNTRHQLVVRRGVTFTVPETVIVAPAQPAVFSRNQTGKGPGVILDLQNRFVEPGNAAKAGDAIVIYCSGLGPVDPPVPAGIAAPASPLARTVHPVRLTIGGVDAQVFFAGLAPGFTGLYQVNAFVPEGVPAGDEVPVVLTTAGQSSPPVTMAVQ